MGVINGTKIDYTQAQEGRPYSAEGVIATCPECGRLGERRHAPDAHGRIRYVHAAEIERTARRGNKLKITAECKVQRT